MLSTCLLAAPLLVHPADKPSDTAALPPEEIIELPIFEVSGKFPAAGWVYIKINNTEFISQLSKNQTVILADDFAIFQEFVRAKYPEAALPADYPLTVVLCSSTESFRSFVPATRSGSSTFPDSNRFILIDTSQINKISKAIRKRWIGLAFRAQPLGKYPLWRELATQELLAATLITDGKLEVGFTPFAPNKQAVKRVRYLGEPAQPTYSAQFNITRGDLLSFDALFQIKRPLPPTIDLFIASMEAVGFMHMCQFSTRHKKWREPFRKFITRLETESFSEELFQECFRISSKDMKSILNAYLFDSSIKYESFRYKFSPTFPFEVRDAEPVEVLRLLRECRRLLAMEAQDSN